MAVDDPILLSSLIKHEKAIPPILKIIVSTDFTQKGNKLSKSLEFPDVTLK